LNKNKQILKILSIAVISAILFVACSKARIEGPIDAGSVDETDNQTGANKLHFVPLTDYYKTKQQKEEIFNCTEYSSRHFTSHNSSFISGNDALMHINGEAALYPIKFHVIELYKLKHFIYYNIQTVSNNKLLITNAIYNINFYKDTNLLIVNSNSTAYAIGIASISSITQTPPVMLYSFTSEMQEGINNWHQFSNNSYEIYDYVYENYHINSYIYGGFTKYVGWLCIADYTQFNTTEYTNLTFTSTNADLTNVGIYICFSDINSYTKVDDCTSIPLPVGEYVKVLAVGITKNNELYYNFKKIVIDKNKTNYDINMKPTTDELLTQILDSL